MGEITDLDAYRRRRRQGKGFDKKFVPVLGHDTLCRHAFHRHPEYLDQDLYRLPVELGRDILGDRFAGLATYVYTRASSEDDPCVPERFNCYMELLTSYIRRAATVLELHHKYRERCRIGQYVALEEEKQAVEEMYLKLNEGW